MEQSEKLIAGALQCLSAMLLLEVPHLNILTKVDILKRRGLEDKLTAFLGPPTCWWWRVAVVVVVVCVGGGGCRLVR